MNIRWRIKLQPPHHRERCSPPPFKVGSRDTIVARWVTIVGIWLVIVILAQGQALGQVQVQAQGQAQTLTFGKAEVGAALVRLGMENVRATATNGNRVTVAFEDNVYRATYRGIGAAVEAALDTLVSCTGGGTMAWVAGAGGGEAPELELVVLDNGVPRLYIHLPPELVAGYREGRVDIRGVYAAMALSYDTDPAMLRLRGVTAAQNRSQWKADVVVYPGLTLQNFRLDRLYSYAVTLSPAVELSPWKGARLTAQVVFPVATNMQGEYRKIRPGVMALTQEFRLPGNWQGELSAGNFTDNRFGGQGGMRWQTANGRLELAALVGVTAYSGIRDGEGWYISTRQRVDGSVRASVYEPHYNLQFDLRAARYVFGDMGVRADCTRHFGEVAIGVYGMVVEGIMNGGFHFTVPLPGKRWKRERAVRIRPAGYFAAEYSREPPGEYMERRMGYTYDTRADANRSERFYQPEFVRYYLMRDQ